MVGVGVKLELKAGVFLGDGSHAFQTKCTENNSPPYASFYLTRNDWGEERQMPRHGPSDHAGALGGTEGYSNSDGPV
jgi:hypothetical protein